MKYITTLNVVSLALAELAGLESIDIHLAVLVNGIQFAARMA